MSYPYIRILFVEIVGEPSKSEHRAERQIVQISKIDLMALHYVAEQLRWDHEAELDAALFCQRQSRVQQIAGTHLADKFPSDAGGRADLISSDLRGTATVREVARRAVARAPNQTTGIVELQTENRVRARLQKIE